jgi:acetyltransferase-like isoleucine patch superfamily enzyme/SAM-dependent methyltransferase
MGFIIARIQMLFWTAFYHAAGRIFFSSLGKGSKFQGWIDIPQRRGRISIGRNVHLCRLVEFSVLNDAKLSIGDGTFIGRGTVISAHQEVTIGAEVLVAEYVSIHDNNHKTRNADLPIARQGFETERLEIGDGCWIGARAVLVQGAGLGRRCVLGAGAVLTKIFPDSTRAAGVPARAMTDIPISIANRCRANSPAPPSPVRCPICEGWTVRVNPRGDYAYQRCLQCETAHLNPAPSGDALNEYYEKFHLRMSDGGIFEDFEKRTSADFPAKARIVARHLQNRFRLETEAPRVVDVGCGKGSFVRQLGVHDLRAEGIDISARAVSEGTTRGIVGLRAGHLSDQRDWIDQFDAATCCATIEHVSNPRDFLDSVHSALKPGGLLFLDTGLAGDAVERWAPGLIQWYDAPQHLFVFSRAGMEKLLRQSGFTVVHMDMNFERTRLRRIVKFIRNRLAAITAHGLFRIALGEAAFQRMRQETKMPFGSLMFVIAKKSIES